ncbi:hypothetical protein NC651_038230 [Populus alba x Populus x berolinensis]|nr:hypothetical protein NC651_038230 [Populus alba x Populus x berolinensis]
MPIAKGIEMQQKHCKRHSNPRLSSNTH